MKTNVTIILLFCIVVILVMMLNSVNSILHEVEQGGHRATMFYEQVLKAK